MNTVVNPFHVECDRIGGRLTPQCNGQAMSTTGYSAIALGLTLEY
ncbi:hypothetical protein [Nostoc sp. NZL]|nr:hypothetical protein [Nostoc sp. NZL]